MLFFLVVQSLIALFEHVRSTKNAGVSSPEKRLMMKLMNAQIKISQGLQRIKEKTCKKLCFYTYVKVFAFQNKNSKEQMFFERNSVTRFFPIFFGVINSSWCPY